MKTLLATFAACCLLASCAKKETTEVIITQGETVYVEVPGPETTVYVPVYVEIDEEQKVKCGHGPKK